MPTPSKKVYINETNKHKNRRRLKKKFRAPLAIFGILAILCIIAAVWLIIRGRKETAPIAQVEETDIQGGLHDYSFLLGYTVDPWTKQVTFYYPDDYSGKYSLYRKNEDQTSSLVCSMSYEVGDRVVPVSVDEAGYGKGNVRFVLDFSENGDYQIPAPGQTLTFVMTADNMTADIFSGRTISKVVEINSDTFSSLEIAVAFEELGDNRYRLSWNETAASSYMIQRKTGRGDWTTVEEVGPDTLSYDTGHLEPCREYTYRVAVLQSDEIVNVSSTFPITTDISVTYATVWPTKDLTLYSDAAGTNSIGTAHLGKSYCVLDVQGKMFHIYTPEGGGYINSDCCMINLPEYVGGLCAYNITNSYFSNYMVHEYEIKGVSGMITEGYENVLLQDGTFLVPLLYPVTDKLIAAAGNAAEDGFRLKIYDSFRPYVATRSIYDITELQLDRGLPDSMMSRIQLSEYLVMRDAGLITARYTDTELIKETIMEENEEITARRLALSQGYVIDPNNPEVYIQLAPDGTADPTSAITAEMYMLLLGENPVTYRMAMLDNRYPLNDFLAGVGSRHNLGVAMDLTLESIETGEEIYAQTRMHDLSFNSELGRNNGSADLLAGYMLDAGFRGLYSEWWHFQDDEVKNRLNPVSVREGVSIEGWKVDDKGVRYRLADGTYVTGEYNIDGTVYVFDDFGYISAP